MAKITVDFSKQKGKIKPVNGVGQPPILYGVDDEMFHYLTEARIPFSRLHDTGGFLGGNRFVDVPNLFRDFDADPDDPAAYDFAFTDVLITSLIKHGVEPFFRLGVSIENDIAIRAYRIDPPKDFHKWAVICEHIIRHYTEGWADGFRYNIRYWEIWNEPDNWEEIELNQEWHATKEVFYEFYGVASIYLKEKFPHLMIGGYGSCGFCSLDGEGTKLANSSPRYAYFVEFFDGFIDYIKAHNCPLDFFSWHSYTTPSRTMGHARYARRRLDEAGYTHTESTCNEWNYRADLRGTVQHAAFTTGMLLGFQDVPLDSAMFYDARCGVSTYSGLFNPAHAETVPRILRLHRLRRAVCPRHAGGKHLRHGECLCGRGDGRGGQLPRDRQHHRQGYAARPVARRQKGHGVQVHRRDPHLHRLRFAGDPRRIHGAVHGDGITKERKTPDALRREFFLKRCQIFLRLKGAVILPINCPISSRVSVSFAMSSTAR